MPSDEPAKLTTVVAPQETTEAAPGPEMTQLNCTPSSASETLKLGLRLLDGESGALTLGPGGGTVSRVHVTVVEDGLPAASVAVTVSEYVPSPACEVSNTPPAGQPPEKIVPPPGPTSVQVRTTPDSLSLMPRAGLVCLVGEVGGTTVGAGGGVVSSVNVTDVCALMFPAASIAVTVNV